MTLNNHATGPVFLLLLNKHNHQFLDHPDLKLIAPRAQLSLLVAVRASDVLHSPTGLSRNLSALRQLLLLQTLLLLLLLQLTILDVEILFLASTQSQRLPQLSTRPQLRLHCSAHSGKPGSPLP